MGVFRRGGKTQESTLSMMHSIAVVVLACGASLALSWLIASSRAQESDPKPPAELGVEWAYRPASLGELTDQSSAVVVAEVEAVRSGEPLATEGWAVPTQLIDLRVTRTLQGAALAELTVYKVGGEGMHPDGSPAYAPGERYLLFVRQRLSDDLSRPHPDGTYLAAAPDGRLELETNGRLDALIPGPVAQRLDGDTVSQASSEIDAAQAAEAGQ